MRNDKLNQTIEETKQEYVYCLRCGKRLHSEENKKRGMGKVCWEKTQAEHNKMQRLF